MHNLILSLHSYAVRSQDGGICAVLNLCWPRGSKEGICLHLKFRGFYCTVDAKWCVISIFSQCAVLYSLRSEPFFFKFLKIVLGDTC